MSPVSRGLGTTAHCSTPGYRPNTASISPSSIRYPRIFTCSSFRPRYSTFPSRPHPTTSPLRYIPPPTSPNVLGTNFSAVTPPSFKYPRPNPAPPIYSSPVTPTGTGIPSSSNTYTWLFANGLPIGTLPCPLLSPSPAPSTPFINTPTVVSVGP